MPQRLSPTEYSKLQLSDQWIEDLMQQVEAEWIFSQLSTSRYVLELGYGAGIITRDLIAGKKEVFVVDGSREFCDRAHRDGASVSHSMFEDFNLGDARKFDAVIASFVLEHVEDPVVLLEKCHQWADRLIVVAGNANSYHRQLAVKMGLQPTIYSLSQRDHQVGHHRVYDWAILCSHLHVAGWSPVTWKGIMLKPLPNSMLAKFDPALIQAMCELDVPFEAAANMAVVCE